MRIIKETIIKNLEENLKNAQKNIQDAILKRDYEEFKKYISSNLSHFNS